MASRPPTHPSSRPFCQNHCIIPLQMFNFFLSHQRKCSTFPQFQLILGLFLKHFLFVDLTNLVFVGLIQFSVHSLESIFLKIISISQPISSATVILKTALTSTHTPHAHSSRTKILFLLLF